METKTVILTRFAIDSSVHSTFNAYRYYNAFLQITLIKFTLNFLCKCPMCNSLGISHYLRSKSHPTVYPRATHVHGVP